MPEPTGIQRQPTSLGSGDNALSPDRIQTRFAAEGVPAWLAKIERI